MIYTTDSIFKNTKYTLDSLLNETKNKTYDKDIIDIFQELRSSLGKAMQLDNVCFLLANGCSIYAGSQSTTSFNMKDILGKDLFDDITRIIGYKEKKTMEDCLNDLVVALDFYQINNDKNEEKVREAINKIKQELLDKYVNSVDYGNLFFHNQMLLKLRAFSCLNRVSFFTLNYDLILEYVMDSLEIEYENGFSGFINRKFDPRSLQTGNITKLVKLHGSVNWSFDDSIGSKNQIKEVKEIQPRFANGKVQVCDNENVLIYPTRQKLYQTFNAPYSELMRYMLNKLESNRNVIIVIGYRYSDEHINDILYKAVANPNNIFYFFDYDHKSEEDLSDSDVFLKRMVNLSNSTQNINILFGKYLSDFRVFVKYMLPAKAEKTDQEKIFDLLNTVLKEQEKR